MDEINHVHRHRGSTAQRRELALLNDFQLRDALCEQLRALSAEGILRLQERTASLAHQYNQEVKVVRSLFKQIKREDELFHQADLQPNTEDDGMNGVQEVMMQAQEATQVVQEQSETEVDHAPAPQAATPLINQAQQHGHYLTGTVNDVYAFVYPCLD